MSDEAKKIAKAAVASLIALSVAQPMVASADDAHKDYIKCYGVAAASKNDCGTVVSACGASISEAGACYAWIFTPKDICSKLAHASPNKPAADCKSPEANPVAAAKAEAAAKAAK